MKVLALLTALVVVVAVVNADEYNIGVGIADITGPAAEIGMVFNLSSIKHSYCCLRSMIIFYICVFICFKIS